MIRPIWGIGTCVVLILIGSSGMAEPDPGARLLDEQQEAQQETNQSPPGSKITAARPGPVKEDICFPIEKIAVRGVTVINSASIKTIIDRFADQCLGQKSIGNLVQSLSAIYADKGYITTRAYVPAQDISGKVLLVDVLEGRIEAFVYQQVNENGTPKAGIPRKINGAFPIKAGEIFNLRAIEHGLEQMNRLPSSQAGANLTPGQAPGTSVVVITERKVDWLRGKGTIDNTGATVTGKTRLSFVLEADDLLNLNETYSISYAGSENTNAIAYNFSIPSGYWLFSSYGSYSEELTILTPVSDVFSQTSNFGLKAERLLFRDDKSKVYAYGAFGFYQNKRFVNIAPLTPQNRANLRFGIRNEHRFENWYFSADTSVAFGVRAFGADWDPAVLFPGSAQAKFKKLETRITLRRGFENGNALAFSFTGQLANAPLFSNEQISVGGWGSVRGYDGFGRSGDSGAYLRADYLFNAKPITFFDANAETKNAKGAWRPYVFMDLGYVHSRATHLSSTLLGVGFGLNATYGRVSINAVGAIPLVEQGGQGIGNFQGQISVTYKFF